MHIGVVDEVVGSVESGRIDAVIHQLAEAVLWRVGVDVRVVAIPNRRVFVYIVCRACWHRDVIKCRSPIPQHALPCVGQLFQDLCRVDPLAVVLHQTEHNDNLVIVKLAVEQVAICILHHVDAVDVDAAFNFPMGHARRVLRSGGEVKHAVVACRPRKFDR